MKNIISHRVRVRCICGHADCLAPAQKGGATGLAVDQNNNIISVVLDGYEEIGALDFSSFSVRKEDA